MQDTVEQIRRPVAVNALTAAYVRAVEDALDAGKTKRVRRLTLGLREADLADLIELLRPDQRQHLIEQLGHEFSFSVLPELEDSLREEVVDALPNDQVAEAVRELDSDDAVEVLEGLDETDQSEVLAQLPDKERVALQRGLDYPEDSAGRIMQTEFVAVPPFWSVGQTIDFMRETDELPNAFSEIFVVDPAYHLIGSVPLSRVLRTKRPILVRDIMDTDRNIVPTDMDQEEVARNFERYNLFSAPVADESGRLVGVVTVDDVVEVIQEEAEEDIHRLGGVGDEAITDTVLHTTQSRFTWLLVNLASAILASFVISLFDATIQQIVALAVLMPIVASMGGNAGTQTMTVTVRALATRDLSVVNAGRVVSRELLVGLLNGLLFAVIMGLVVLMWFGSGDLGLIIAFAMIVNLFVAGLAGILIPIALDKIGIDPAVASSVFVTTVTDVVGFFVFLGLAALWFT